MTAIEKLEWRKDYWNNRIYAFQPIAHTDSGKAAIKRAEAEIRILNRRIERLSKKTLDK